MERNALILLAAGRDRPGIVDRISGVVYEAGCNLEDSRMSILGGEFALIVMISGQPEHLTRAEADLGRVARELDLILQVKPTQRPRVGEEPAHSLAYRLTAVSMDHPGIVHKITHFLSSRRINVARLDTRLSHAPVSGTPVFSLELEALLPADLPLARFRTELAGLAEEENIDIALHPAES